VKLSVKSDYAARAVLGLTRLTRRRRALRVETLAAAQGVPPNYLIKYYRVEGKRASSRSVRARKEDICWHESPAEITLGDVLNAVHGRCSTRPR